MNNNKLADSVTITCPKTLSSAVPYHIDMFQYEENVAAIVSKDRHFSVAESILMHCTAYRTIHTHCKWMIIHVDIIADHMLHCKWMIIHIDIIADHMFCLG